MKIIKRFTDSFAELAVLYLSLVSLGAVVYHFAEGKAMWDSVWWAFVTSMTVGYGDMFPVTVIGRIDAIFLMHVVPLFVIPLVVAQILANMLEDKNKFTHEEQEKLIEDVAFIRHAIGGNHYGSTD